MLSSRGTLRGSGKAEVSGQEGESNLGGASGRGAVSRQGGTAKRGGASQIGRGSGRGGARSLTFLFGFYLFVYNLCLI